LSDLARPCRALLGTAEILQIGVRVGAGDGFFRGIVIAGAELLFGFCGGGGAFFGFFQCVRLCALAGLGFTHGVVAFPGQFRAVVDPIPRLAISRRHGNSAIAAIIASTVNRHLDCGPAGRVILVRFGFWGLPSIFYVLSSPSCCRRWRHS